MKIVFTMQEVRRIVADVAMDRLRPGSYGLVTTPAQFIHKYPDASGEADVEILGHVDRVEVDFIQKKVEDSEDVPF